MPLPTGTLLHQRYRIVSILGQGGMGAVYRADDENVGVPVAIKENLFLTTEYTRQFQQEARILASLRHAGLPHVTDYFVLEGQGQYLAMDFIEGEDLRQRMERSGPITEKEAILIGISVLDALHHLHTRNPAIIHRDIKPGNIKITPEGQTVLVDFGLAKVLNPGQATITGARAMTPGYSPPEQYGTSSTDERSDIYSLGATLYACLTGTVPEDGLVRLSGKSDSIDIRDLTPRINKQLAEIINKAMEVDPEDRFQTAREFRKALIDCGEMAAFFKDQPTIAPPPQMIPPSGESSALPASQPSKRQPGKLSRSQRESIARFLFGFSAAMVVFALVFLLFFRDSLTKLANQGTLSTPGTDFIPFPDNPTQPLEPGEQTSPPPEQTAEFTQEPTSPILETAVTTQEFTPTPTPLGGNQELAFASARSGSVQIWIIDTTTKQLRQVTNMRDGACQPSWSPDGLRLAFTSPCPGKREQYPGSSIYLVDADGGNLTPLAPSPEGDYDPAWAPDGKHLAFTSLRNGKPAIFLLNLSTLTTESLTNADYAEFQPSWSTKSRQIAYIRNNVYNQVWIMTEDGARKSQFSQSGPLVNSYPSWSADGNVIYYSQASPDSTIPRLVGMRYDDRGSPLEFRIPAGATDNIGPISSASMSNDGFWFAYEGWPDGVNHDIYLMTANGASVTRLTTDSGLEFNPAWRPILR